LFAPTSPLFPYTTLFRSELDLGRPMSVTGNGLNDGIGLGHVVLHEPRIVVTNLFNEDSQAELVRLEEALGSLRISIDDMLSRRRSEEHTSELQSRENIVC